MPKRKTKSASKNKLVRATPTPNDIGVCFVIMPFGGWLDDYYETIYKPAIIAAGLEPHRADDLYRPTLIVNDIWAYTQRAKLLVADLTGRNPNVFYELGLAHALGKPVILIAESKEDIPFDLRGLRFLLYDKNDPRWGEQLQNKVEAAIKEVLHAPQKAVHSAFLHVREPSETPSVTPREKDIIELKQQMNLLRQEVRSQPMDSSRPVLSPRIRLEVEELIRRHLRQSSLNDIIGGNVITGGISSFGLTNDLHLSSIASPTLTIMPPPTAPPSATPP